MVINLLTPNDNCSGRTAPLTSKCCILYIYSTNIGTEYFKHGIYSQFFPLQNTVCFINLTYLVSVLFTFYIQGVLKLKKNNSGAKRLRIKFVSLLLNLFLPFWLLMFQFVWAGDYELCTFSAGSSSITAWFTPAFTAGITWPIKG